MIIHIQSLAGHTHVIYLQSQVTFHPKPFVGLETQKRGHLYQVSRVMSKKVNPWSKLPLKKYHGFIKSFSKTG